ncbi:MAG: hypothetical protein ACRD1P_12700 [Thermoanaerobaculia bacterium]
MIAFEVQRNGMKLCLAGVGAGVLTVGLTWVGRRSRGEAASQPQESGLTLHVGGLEAWGDDAGQSLRWLHDSLEVGDSVSIRILEASATDAPLTREPEDPEVAEKVERMNYEKLREKYEARRG